MSRPLAHPMNLDLQCFRCGAFNLLENRICGKCGANLPVVFDSEGKPAQLQGAPPPPSYSPGVPRRFRPSRSPMMRALVLSGGLLAVFLLYSAFAGWTHPLFSGGLVVLLLSGMLFFYRNR